MIMMLSGHLMMLLAKQRTRNEIDMMMLDVGGVVMLASKVDELTKNTVRVENAPETYDQTHAQSIVAAINSLASKQNDIIGKVNELIQALQDAKQMQSNADLG